MSAVDEVIVREYFESHGFLVCQRRKSDLLQTLRLLKNYGLLQDPQLEFKWRGKKRKE